MTHTHPRALRTVLGAAALLTLAPLLTAPPADAVTAQQRIDTGCRAVATAADPATTLVADRLQISPAAATSAMTDQLRAGDLGVRLESALGADRFAGVWIERDTVVAASTAVEDIGAIQDAAVGCGIGRVEIRTVDRPLAALRADTDKMAAAVAALGLTDYAVGPDLAANRVRMSWTPAATSTSDSVLLAGLAALVGADLDTTAGPAAMDGCTGDTCPAPLRGGVAITSAGPTCSTAFVTKPRSGSGYSVLSAGHCGGVGTAWASGGTSIGSTAQAVDAPMDYARIAVASPGGWGLPAGYVFVRATGGQPRDELYPIRASGRSAQGMAICKSGATTDTTCGTVTGIEATVNSRGKTYTKMNRSNYCRDLGDSGSAVFSNNTAIGIHSGGFVGCDAFYQPLVAVLDTLGQDVVTVSDPNIPYGTIRKAWLTAGGSSSPVGDPTGPETDSARSGRQQQFEHGTIVWNPTKNKAWLITDPILGRFTSAGGVAEYGFPTMDAAAAKTSPQGTTGSYQKFDSALVLTSAATGAHLLHGDIRAHFEANGYETAFGYPTGEEARQGDGSITQTFQGGTLRWTPDRKVVWLPS